MKKNSGLSALFFALLVIGGGIGYWLQEQAIVAPPAVISAPALPELSLEEAFPHIVARNSTLFSMLRELEVSPQTIQQIVEAAKPFQNLTKMRAGIRFQVTQNNDPVPEIQEIRFRYSAIDQLAIRKLNGVWTAEQITEQVELKNQTFYGTVTSSLWESAQRAKMDPNLISELADIFGWEVDFSREVRAGDRWRLTVQQKLVKGSPIGWGAILAAEYNNAGEAHQAVLFRINGDETGYFTPEGESLRKMFLKSPIRYGRITSGFNLKRFHPILGTSRPHLGVDFAAPVGTPIRAVGDGTVLFAARSGGGGNVVKLRHASMYQTAYKHMSAYAKGIRPGVHVQQGQVIGYVGNTGLSTGPHCHFEFYEGGRFIDPVHKKFPSAEPVPETQMAQFKAEATNLLQNLPPWDGIAITAQDTK